MKDYAEINLSTGGKKIYETPYQCSIQAGVAAFNAETNKAGKLKDAPDPAPDGYEYYLKGQEQAGPVTLDQSLADSVRYTYKADGSLDVEAAPKNGQTLKLKIVRANGQPIVMQSSGGQPLSGNTYYPPGPLTGHGSYTQEWSFRPTGAGGSGIPQEQLTITLATDNESATVPFSFTPAVATRQVLFTAPGSTPTNPPTPAGYNRVLVFGNSITHNYYNSNQGGARDWGMDASAANKDFFHILKGYLQTLNAGVQVRECNDFSGLTIASGPYWEITYATHNLEEFGVIADWKPDLIIMRVAENVQGTAGFGDRYKALIDKLKSQNSSAVVVLSTSVWNTRAQTQVDLSTIITQVGTERSYPVANLNNIAGAVDGQDAHPNDGAMQIIADRIWEKIPKSNSGTSPGSNTPTTIQGGYSEGSLANLLALCPFIPDNNQLGSWGDRTLQRLTNANIQFGIHKSICGSVTEIIDKRRGDNLINTFSYGSSNPDQWDTGRSADFSVYGGPNGGNIHPYYEGGQNTAQTGDDTGYNGVAGGSRSQDRSRIEFFQRKTVSGYGEVLYVSTLLKQWSIANIFTQYRRHAFYWLDGATVRFIYIIENFRTDNQVKNQERQQEGPFLYLRADHYAYKMEFSPGNVTTFAAPVPFQNGESSPTSTQVKVGARNYIGGYNPNTGYGLTLFTPYCSRFEGKQAMSRNSDDPGANDSAYISAAPMVDMDSQANTLFSGYFHVGTHDEFKSWLSAANPALRSFNFDFSGARFQGWASGDGRLIRENGEMVFYLGDSKPYNPSERGNAVLNSPYGSWDAGAIATLKMNIAVANASQIEIRWFKPGQTDETAVMQRKVVSVTGDNQFREYSFNMAGAAGWDGIISRVTIGVPTGGSVNGSEKIRLGKIYA